MNFGRRMRLWPPSVNPSKVLQQAAATGFGFQKVQAPLNPDAEVKKGIVWR